MPSTTPAPIEADVGPNLDRLWAYQCSHTKNQNVSCIAWNRLNPVSNNQTMVSINNKTLCILIYI